jgi:hypothetical protein
LSLVDFEVQLDPENQPVQIQCPQGQSVAVETGNQKKGFVACFQLATCQDCPFGQNGQCPAQPVRKKSKSRLSFSEKEMYTSQRRKRALAIRTEKHNLRAAIEATCRAIKCRFTQSKFPVLQMPRQITLTLISKSATIFTNDHGKLKSGKIFLLINIVPAKLILLLKKMKYGFG